MSDKVKVRVTFRSEVTFGKDVEMTQKEYDFYCAEMDRAREDRESREYEIELFDELGFSLTDPADWDDPELDVFEVQK